MKPEIRRYVLAGAAIAVIGALLVSIATSVTSRHCDQCGAQLVVVRHQVMGDVPPTKMIIFECPKCGVQTMAEE